MGCIKNADSVISIIILPVRITMQDERFSEITERTAERKSERKELPNKNCSRYGIHEYRGKVSPSS